MSTLRFSIVAAGLFAMAFIGISWANKGFPVMANPIMANPIIAMRVAPLQPDARVPTFEQSVKQGLRKDWENSKTAQGDGDPKRETLRLEALQAATAFALSPCDATMKKNLVEALSAYARAWTEMAGCKFGVCGGNDNKIDAAAAAFATPADMQVRAALRTAFEKGGVSRGDFPNSIRLWVTMLVGDPGDPVSACATGKRAEGPLQ
jgi:hypothetical protein